MMMMISHLTILIPFKISRLGKGERVGVVKNDTMFHLSHVMRKPSFCICKNKGADSWAVTAQLISASVFATLIVKSLFSLNPKVQASNHFLWLTVQSVLCLTW